MDYKCPVCGHDEFACSVNGGLAKPMADPWEEPFGYEYEIQCENCWTCYYGWSEYDPSFARVMALKKITPKD